MNATPPPARGQLPSIDRASINGSLVPQAEPDPFEHAYDWLWVVPSMDDMGLLARCVELGFNVAHSGQRRLKNSVKKRDVIVVIPAHGPGRITAIETANILRPYANKLVEWICPELGHEDTPNLKAIDEKYGKDGLARLLGFERPWLIKAAAKAAPSANGNGKHAQSSNGNGNGRHVRLEDGKINYEVLTMAEWTSSTFLTSKRSPRNGSGSTDWLPGKWHSWPGKVASERVR